MKVSFRLLLFKGGYVNVVTYCNFPTCFPLFPSSQRFTSIPHSGATGTTSTFQEERPCLTNVKPSYQPTGTHPSPRYVSVWRSDFRQDSSSSPSGPTPCTHWSPMVITTQPHWVVTRGSHWLDRQLRCSPTVTRKGLTLCLTEVTMAKQESVSLVITKTTVQLATPGSGLVLVGYTTWPTLVETRLHMEEITETSTSKPWATFWYSDSRLELKTELCH